MHAMTSGTALYRQVIAYDYGNDDLRDLVREAWSQTPWMVDAHTGGSLDDPIREAEIRSWCTENFGPEHNPWAGPHGKWQRGSATIHGRTWMGFATEDMMQQFIERWPPEAFG